MDSNLKKELLALRAEFQTVNAKLDNILESLKQEVFEDDLVIERVKKAPERKVFYIDLCDLDKESAVRYIDEIKKEIHSRRNPEYAPLSMEEDYISSSLQDGLVVETETDKISRWAKNWDTNAKTYINVGLNAIDAFLPLLDGFNSSYNQTVGSVEDAEKYIRHVSEINFIKNDIKQCVSMQKEKIKKLLKYHHQNKFIPYYSLITEIITYMSNKAEQMQNSDSPLKYSDFIVKLASEFKTLFVTMEGELFSGPTTSGSYQQYLQMLQKATEINEISDESDEWLEEYPIQSEITQPASTVETMHVMNEALGTSDAHEKNVEAMKKITESVDKIIADTDDMIGDYEKNVEAMKKIAESMSETAILDRDTKMKENHSKPNPHAEYLEKFSVSWNNSFTNRKLKYLEAVMKIKDIVIQEFSKIESETSDKAKSKNLEDLFKEYKAFITAKLSELSTFTLKDNYDFMRFYKATQFLNIFDEYRSNNLFGKKWVDTHVELFTKIINDAEDLVNSEFNATLSSMNSDMVRMIKAAGVNLAPDIDVIPLTDDTIKKAIECHATLEANRYIEIADTVISGII